MRKYFIIFAFWKLTNMYLNGYEKVWPLSCPFKPYWWVHSNISGIFERFSIRLCFRRSEPSRKSLATCLSYVWENISLSLPFGNWQICTSMVMKKAGHCSVHSNQTGEYTAIFLASLINFLSDYVLKIGRGRNHSTQTNSFHSFDTGKATNMYFLTWKGQCFV